MLKQQNIELVAVPDDLYYHNNTGENSGGNNGERERGGEGRNPYTCKTI